MAVKRLFQTRQQFLDASGNLAAGYRLFFYAAGTTSKQSTYTASDGATPNSNPIVLNSLGQSANEIWGTVGLSYKLALATAGVDDPPGAFIWTEDNITPINDVTSELTIDQWLQSGVTPTYISSTSFSVPGDKTSTFLVGRRIKSTVNGGTAYSRITVSSFGSGITTVTVVNDSVALDAGINSVALGIITPTNTSLPWMIDSSTTFVDDADTTKRAQFQLSSIATGTTRTYTLPDVSLTVAGRDNSETLTNKTLTSPTLTSPTINGGTISSATLNGGAIQAHASITTTSGATAAFTSIPNWARMLVLTFIGVSVSGTEEILIQLGDSGGLETSGYTGVYWYGASGVNSGNLDTGFRIENNAASGADTFSGQAIFTLADASTNTWTASGMFASSASATSRQFAGHKALSAALDRLTVLITGADTFDAGKISLSIA